LSLDEDVGSGDLTTELTVRPEATATASVVVREDCTVSGLALFPTLARIFAGRNERGRVSAVATMIDSVGDGARVEAGTVICRLDGPTRTLLTLERTFLNFVGRMSGVATLTARYVAAVAETGAQTRILDTRKTTPGHRLLEKYAVRCGGGANHRMGLFDAVLIKDNHVAAAGSIAAAVRIAHEGAGDSVAVEVECDTLTQVKEALGAGARHLLLDNFTPEDVSVAVELSNGRACIEVSGGVTLATVGAYARAGADDISIGRLTHSAPSVDVSMEIASER